MSGGAIPPYGGKSPPDGDESGSEICNSAQWRDDALGGDHRFLGAGVCGAGQHHRRAAWGNNDGNREYGERGTGGW